eukprot:g2759.t1
MQTILETPDVTWQELQGGKGVLNSGAVLGAISGLAVLPEIGGDEQQGPRKFDDTTDDNADRVHEQLLPAGHTDDSTSGDDLKTISPDPQKIGGFEGSRHTVHLGRTQPTGHIVQVTEDAVNVVRQAASGSFELAASWRPTPLPSRSSPSFKVQHAGTAGTVVAVVCESTMFLIDVWEVATNQATTGRTGSEKPASPAASAAVQAKEVLRVELDGGPVSTLGMRLLGGRGADEESVEPTPARVLIAIASWDSASVVVFSFPASPTASINASKPDNQTGVGTPSNRCTAAARIIGTWLPPWGGSPEAAKVLEARREGGGIARLTRALAFVRFGAGSEGLSLVAATGDGTIAVAEWRGDRGKGDRRKGHDTGDNSFFRGTLATTASFQVGRGPVRLEVFETSGLPAGEDSGGERDCGGDEERLFVNGDVTDAVIHRSSNPAEMTASGQYRGTWRCTQVCRTGRQPRRSVVSLPQRKTSERSNGRIRPQFSWLTTEHPAVEPGGHSGGDGERAIGMETSRGVLLSFGSLDDIEPRGRCSHKPLPWTPTHLVYVPTSRSIVVACHTSSDKREQDSPTAGKTTINAGTAPAPRCGAQQPAPPSIAASRTRNSASCLRIFDADTLEVRPGTGPLCLRPGVRITGVALLPGLGCPVGGAAPSRFPRLVPATAAAAVGGDVVAVACCSCASTTESEERLRGSGARPAAGVTTVVAAFEVVASGGNGGGGTVGEDGEFSSRTADGIVGGGRDCGDGTRLAALAASPEMAGAWFGLETLGKQFVAGSVDNRIIVLGWEGCQEQQGIRPDKPVPPLKLIVRASCRTATGACITALATLGKFVAAAELLHCVSIYRYNESSRTLSLVAAHSRDRLVVTALALSPRPLDTSGGSCGQEHSSETSAPLVALADRTTGTVAVLSISRSSPPTATTHTAVRDGADNGTDDRGGDGSGEEGAGVAARHLRLLSVWPCRENVTALVVAASLGQANWVDCEDDECEDDHRGKDEQHRRHQRHRRYRHRYQDVVDEASRFAGASGRNRADMFLMGTASAEEGSGHNKSALTPTYFSHNHFSSSVATAKDPMARRTRITVKVLEGKNLLVSDLLTGTSDPLALLWVGSCDEGEVDLKYDKRVQSTEVCKHTVDPVWDAEFVFPLEIQTVQDLLTGQVNVLVRDCDDADGDVHFVDLGRVSIPLETVLTQGNIMAHTQLVQLPARWYPLQRCRGVKKSRGALKIAVRFFVGPDSALLQHDDSSSEALEQGNRSALRFENHIKRLRGDDGTNGRGVTVSMSPPRGTSRELTKRGGTTFLRPKSAPEATTLTSPLHLRQRPFEGRSLGASPSWDQHEGAIVRAHRWQRRLLESMQRLEDRSTEGAAYEWGRIANSVPKEAVLLPGGCAVIELSDAATAASFFDRITATAGGLPSNWRIDPFPEDFCARINLARVAHHARLTVNSEEILASLLDALGNGRPEATRAQLFDAIAALAQSFALYGGPDLQDSDAALETSAAEAAASRRLNGIPSTLQKGLPAIARAILEVLDCPVRRAYTWKERKAALEVTTSLAVLTELRGTHGPLGEHRAKLIQGASRGKHDSVAAVREAAIEALAALEATEADEGKPEVRRPFSAPAGVGGFASEMARKFRKEERGAGGKGVGTSMKSKTLDSVVRKAERAKIAATEAPQHETPEGDREPVEGDILRSRRERERKREGAEAADTLVPAERTPPASWTGEDPLVAANHTQQAPPHTARDNLEAPFPVIDGRESEQNSNHNAADRREPVPPITPENSNPKKIDDVAGDSSEHLGRQCSEGNISTPQTHDDAAAPEEHGRRVPLPPLASAGTGAKHAPTEIDAEVSVPDKRRPQVQVSTSVQVGPQLQEAKHLTAASGVPVEAAAKVASSPLPAPLHGGMEFDTLRLLQHLDSKTDKITSVLDGLDRRLHGVERTLVERPLASDSPKHSPSGRRKLKRPRSSQAASSSHHKPNNSTSKPARGPGNPRSTRRTTNLKRDLGLLLEGGDVESAFRKALSSGTERDVLRLMGKAGGPDLCRHRLGMETRDHLFAFLARTISAGRYAEHALPWVFEIVRAGETRGLSLTVRMQLAGALHGLAASPTDQGVVAARLGPYLSLTSVGRPSLSDATEAAGVLGSMEIGGSCGIGRPA